MSEFNTIIKALIVLPVDESIFSELATTMEIDDEGGGHFVKVSQSATGDNCITITSEDWPHIRLAIDMLLEECDVMKGAAK